MPMMCSNYLQGVSAKDTNYDTSQRWWKTCRRSSCYCGQYSLQLCC